jgi:predicted DNA-binding transcriptional regulator AlpA
MKLIRYNDLVEKGVVNSRMTLKRLIDAQDFPPGVLVTPNARAWQEEEVDAWIAARPAARKTSTLKKASTTPTTQGQEGVGPAPPHQGHSAPTDRDKAYLSNQAAG